MAISEEMALKYFGESAPVGQIITLISGKNRADFVVSGVFRKPASKSLLDFDMVKYAEVSERFAFIMLKDKADVAALETLFEREKERIPSINDGTPGRYYLKSLKEAYFDT
ncbi:MAG: ABC transporter permease [Bacteroidales bacterium]